MNKEEQSIKISIKTAKVCQALLDIEIGKNAIGKCYSKKQIREMKAARNELNEDYDIALKNETQMILREINSKVVNHVN